jgi:hypothetical protein
MTRYIHFTDMSGAKAIRQSGVLMASSFISGVYAVKEGSPFVPGVQQTTLGRAKNRKVAVVFTTPLKPDYCYPEECVWRLDEIPVKVERVMLASQAVKDYLQVVKEARTPYALGLPGGPCHIIRDIEAEKLPERVKQELIEDIEKGKDLSNSAADLIYPPQRFNAKADLFSKVLLTSHAQYRMNLRGITLPEIQDVFVEFDKWYKARAKKPKSLTGEQRKLMTDLAYGEAARFEGSRSGITIVFAVDSRKNEARLVSCWWTNSPKTPKPTPGQCDFVPYLDKDRSFDRPSILGHTLMKDIAHKVARRVWFTSRQAAKPGPDPDKGDGLNTWFSDKAKGGDWVAISPVKKTIEKEDGTKKTFEPGDIVGPCGDPDGEWKDLTNDGDDPLKCLNKSRAKGMSKKERAEAAKAKKREEKKAPEGQKPTHVDTEQEKKSHEIAKAVARRLFSQMQRTSKKTYRDLLNENEVSEIQRLLGIARNNLDVYQATDTLDRNDLQSREVLSVLEEVTGSAALFEVDRGRMHHDLVDHMKTWEKLCKAARFDWKASYQKTLDIFS